MAQTTKLTRRQIEVNLRELWVEVDGMPEIAKEWSRYSDEDRSFYWFEWPDLLDGFEDLASAYATGRLTPEQQACYERLVHRYEEILPIIQQLGLQSIPVPKLHSRR